MITLAPEIEKILNNEQIKPETVIRDGLFWVLLNKKEKYSIEIRQFEHKYSCSFLVFQEKIRKQKMVEDFEIEDDLMEWEFVVSALNTVNNDLNQIKHYVFG